MYKTQLNSLRKGVEAAETVIHALKDFYMFNCDLF